MQGGEIERLEKWRPLEVTPAALANFHYVHGLIGTIPNSDTDAVRSSLKAHPELELEEVFTSETEHGYVILYRSGRPCSCSGASGRTWVQRIGL